MFTLLCIAGQHGIAVRALETAVSLLGADGVLACPCRTDTLRPHWQPSLRRYAMELGVPLVELPDLLDIADLTFLSLEFDRIIQPDAFRSRKLFNVHFSLLPAYKGVYTAAWPILNSDTHTGATLHCIDQGIDTGPIIAQQAFPIGDTWTARDVYLQCMQSGSSLAIDAILNQGLSYFTAQPQTANGSSYYSRQSIDYSRIRIDLNATAVQVQRQIRAMHFREFQIPHLEGLPIAQAEVMHERSAARPGTVIHQSKDELVLATIDYNILCHRDRSLDYFRIVDSGDADAVSRYPHGSMYINISNSKGWTPLMIASFGGRADICEALLKRGADPNLGNPNGTTALMFAKDHAIQTGDTSTINVLRRYGADPNVRDRFGRTVVDYLRQALPESRYTAIVLDALVAGTSDRA